MRKQACCYQCRADQATAILLSREDYQEERSDCAGSLMLSCKTTSQDDGLDFGHETLTAVEGLSRGWRQPTAATMVLWSDASVSVK